LFEGWLLWLLGVGCLAGLWIGWLSGDGMVAAPYAGPWFWLSVMVYYPILEELLFRGALQGSLWRWGCWSRHEWLRISGANLIASLAFVCVHLLHQAPAWALAVLAPSLAFGYFRDRSRSILYPIMMHAIWNGSFFLGRVLSVNAS
jgi:membrane protease YdiL (CAAX protease family)